ncbi:MAG TPA: IPT/TIG domain-containing protein, partial [Dehalococcoidia bacterium]
MNLLIRLVIVLVLCLIAMALPAVPAQAQSCGVPFIELSSKSGAPGTGVAVAGQRFSENAYVVIYYDGTIVATGRTDTSERFSIIFTIPESYQGDHRVYAEVLDETAEAYFTVKPGLTVSPEKGPAGTMVTVKGQGFAENEEGIALRYYLNGSYETVGNNITANAQGTWQTSFPIPLSAQGEHKLDARSAESKLYDVEDAIFKVTPDISIDKSSGIVGESITMMGSSFEANENNIKILFAGEAVVTNIKANAQGQWEKTFQVPEMPAGEYSITVEGDETQMGDISGLSFEIKPDIV